MTFHSPHLGFEHMIGTLLIPHVVFRSEITVFLNFSL